MRLKCSILSLPTSPIFSFCHPYISFHLFPWQLRLISSTPPFEHPSCHPIPFLLTPPYTHTHTHQRLFSHPLFSPHVSHLSTYHHFFLERQPHPPSLLVLQLSPSCLLFFIQLLLFFLLLRQFFHLKTHPLLTHYLHSRPLLAALCAPSPFELCI